MSGVFLSVHTRSASTPGLAAVSEKVIWLIESALSPEKLTLRFLGSMPRVVYRGYPVVNLAAREGPKARMKSARTLMMAAIKSEPSRSRGNEQ